MIWHSYLTVSCSIEGEWGRRNIKTIVFVFRANFFMARNSPKHGLINNKDTKTKCRLCWCITEFIDWRYSHVSIFDPALRTFDPLTFSLVHPPPSPFPKSKYVYTDSVWLGGGGGCYIVCWRPYSAGVQHSVSDQIQSLQYCFTTPDKNLVQYIWIHMWGLTVITHVCV